MVLKALIVDDEYPAREELRFRLEKYEDVEIIGEATNAREAMRLIEALDYDVVFLDVQMPGVNGMDLARQLRARPVPPRLVFVTAHDHYAVPAFEMRAVDYLLKPFDEDRLAETIQRLREAHQGPRATEEAARSEERRAAPIATWVMAERDDRQIPVPFSDIVFIFSEGYNVYLQTASERLVTRYTLQELTDRLPSDQFFRCHRSYLVNIYQVKELSPYFNGAYLLRMKDKAHSEVLVSRANVKRLKELFSIT